MTIRSVLAVSLRPWHLRRSLGRALVLTLIGLLTVAGGTAAQQEETILKGYFDDGEDGFVYVDDPFRGTAEPAYASGAWNPYRGYEGGGLEVQLGGLDGSTVVGMSGGWRRDFTFNRAGTATLAFYYKLTQSPPYEPDEQSQVLVSIDGTLVGEDPQDYVAQIAGDGDGGPPVVAGWKLATVHLGTLGPGPHTLIVGGVNSQKSDPGEVTQILIDNLLLVGEAIPDPAAGAKVAIASLSFDRFKQDIQVLAGFGDRTQGSASFHAAAAWLVGQLQIAGYTVKYHTYTYLGQPRQNIFVTKVGKTQPGQMYMVSAHFDGRGGGGAADDDGSGVALVLEAARALALPGLETDVSVRFIFWNNEETGLNGSTAYVVARRLLQGIQNPPGSGQYPEPTWLGIVQHDMLLFDHGLPPGPVQSPTADIDVEYQAASAFASQSSGLASALHAGNGQYSTDYLAEVGSNMNFTDSMPFRNHTAAVSVRENQRVAEIGQGSNPHWHKASDLYTAYSELDFRLGFNALQMTLGTIAELAGATVPLVGP